MKQPKGGMCLSCKKRDENCSHLCFDEMPAINKSDKNIVKCSFYVSVGKSIG